MVKSAMVVMYQVTFPRRRLCISPGKLYNKKRMVATLWRDEALSYVVSYVIMEEG